LERSGRLADARLQYERIVGEFPQAALAAARLAVIYADHGGNLDTALALAMRAKPQLPHEAEISDALGWVYVRKGVLSLAIPQLQNAVAAAPTNGTYAYHLATAYWQMDRGQLAREQFLRALALAPDAVWAPDAKRKVAAMAR
jgi:tetratricopeptide (TPR) repeat protein